MKERAKFWILLAVCVMLSASAHAEGVRLRDKLGMGTEGQDAAADTAVSWHYRDMPARYPGAAAGKDSISLTPKEAQPLDGEATLAQREGKTVLLWSGGEAAYSWDFAIESEGLYQIYFTYTALSDDPTQIVRTFLLDGEVPFAEAANFQLPQTWIEKEAPFFDINGDEVAPGLVQWERSFTYGLTDVNGLYAQPFGFYLEKGQHTLTLGYASGSVALENIHITGIEEIPTYQEYSAGPLPDYAGEAIIVQGEDALYRSDMIQRRFYYADVNTQPFDLKHIRRNVIGGWRWQTGNAILTWRFEVPQDGAYTIVTRALQDNAYGIPSTRKLQIDGQTPFLEAQELVFQYDRAWQGYVLQDASGEPYRFYLKKGTHDISLTVQCGPMAELILDLQQTNLLLSDTLQDIIKITGVAPDTNFQYQLEKKIPWLLERLEALVTALESQEARLEAICGAVPQASNAYVSAIEELKYALNHPERIPGKLDVLITCQAALAETYTSFLYSPLTIDYIALASPSLLTVEGSSGFMDKLNVTFYNFISSFSKNYDNLSKRAETQKEVSSVINVWVGRSKEWGELIQSMADEDFTPETGIAVKVNIIPGGTSASGLSPLMLSIITGNAPDLVVGSDSGSPFELAIRGAALDLTRFDDYPQVASRFFESALTPFTFEGKVYALPETLDTSVMFYRTDIFGELGLLPPKTWDELMYRTIPVLKQNGYQFYISTTATPAAPSGFDMFLWQNGGDYYNASLTETGLSTDAAFRAFEKWTRLYTMYDTPVDANAFNHFRVGDIPLFIGTLADYMTVSAAAPDLYGRWAVTSVPGEVKADELIDNTAGGTLMATMIFSQTKQPDQAWEFLKWWTSDAMQNRFATEIEAIMNRNYRWFSANKYAFSMRPTNRADMEVFLAALDNVRFMTPTIGGYITARHVVNAWTRVVVATSSEVTPRDSLEAAVKEINRELRRKQVEYQWTPKMAAAEEE